jgi:predicted molibdopterin-dependent oxidoreductase YjgC
MQIVIDGKVVEANEGQTILQIAKNAGIYIPTLCFMEKLLPIGSCRMCIVEVEGYENLVTACNTKAIDGMVIRTNTEKIRAARRDILRFMLINHPLDCPICDKAGECLLQDLVYEYNVDTQPYTSSALKKEYKEYSTPAIKYHPNRCVLCSRCVRVCREVVGRNVLDIVGNGIDARIEPVNPERCIACGECLSVCPVGALTETVSPTKGRLWQIKRVPTICGYCGVGCGLELNVYDNKVIKVTTNVEAGPNKGTLCVKGRFGYEFINSSERLTKPLIRKNGELVETTWEEALSFVANKLLEIKNNYGPDSIAGLTSARCTNEDNYVFQKFIRAVIGTNNIDHCARL